MTTSYEKKKKRNLIMLLSVLVVLLVAAIVVPKLLNKKEEENNTEDELMYLTNINKADITAIHYSYVQKAENDEGKDKNVDIKFVFKDSRWYLDGDDDFPVSQGNVSQNLVEGITKFQVGKKIENPGDLSKYGLDENIFKIDVGLKDGSVVTITAGQYNEVMNGYYVSVSGDDAVYMVGGTREDTIYDLFRSNVYEYAVMDTLPSVSSDTLQFISIVNGIGKVELTYKADGVDYDLVNSSYWFFQAPFSRLMPTVDDKIDDAISIITGMSYSLLADYNATDEELKKYGITDSQTYYSISYYEDKKDDSATSSDGETEKILKTYKMIIGSLNEAGDSYYVRPVTSDGVTTEESRKISLVDKDTIENLLGIDPIDYMYRYATYVSFNDLLGGGYMQITTPNSTGKVTIEEYSEKLNDGGEQKYKKYFLDDKELSEDDGKAISNFYNKYMTSFVKQIFYEDTKKVEVNPTYTIEYHLVGKSIEKQVVQYTKYDDNFYQVTVDGYTDVMVSKQDIDDAFAILASLVK